MELWQGWRCDNLTAIHSWRKAVDAAVVPVQKFRDVQKLYAAMTDGKMEYVLYGAEKQAEIHYAMPVKNNLYDALEYAGQVEEAAKSHRKEMKRKKGRDCPKTQAI